jgi:serine/threonine protein kinase
MRGLWTIRQPAQVILVAVWFQPPGVNAMSDSSDGCDPLDRLVEEFLERHRAGQRPSVNEYAARLPGREDEIRDLFPALVELEQLKPSTRDGTVDHTPPPPASAHPERVGEYRILRLVGRGGMGTVYEAVQESLGRHVALKLLPAEAMKILSSLPGIDPNASAG